MRYARIFLGLAGLAALSLVALSALESRAGAWAPSGLGDAAEPAPMATKVAVWRECQEIAFCTGCKPRYKCRSCEYRRMCSRGLCEWRDVCKWGPVVRVLPHGVRIIQVK